MNPKTLGIVGGGQLGRMLTLAAKDLGIKTIVLDPTEGSPAGLVASSQIVGDYKDPKDIKHLADKVDFLTLEIESVNAQAFIDLKKQKVAVNPSGKTLMIIQDKYLQKVLLKKHKIPTPDFVQTTNESDIIQASQKFGLPIVLKARKHGFDGRGNVRIKNLQEIKEAMKKLSGFELYAEQFIPFKKELAIQFVKQGPKIHFFPLVETFQKNDICHKVLAPAPVSEKIKKEAIKITKKIATILKGDGVFAVELFLTNDDRILVNEIAPRVHNSGHYTIEGCNVSQFEQHIRSVCKLPLKSAKMKTPASVMINILGTKNAPARPKGIVSAQKIEGVFVHIYDKKETKIGRKMGHITAVGENLKEALQKAEQAKKLVSI